MSRASRYASSVISDRQVDGASFLYRGIPRSFLLLLALFLAVYGAYWSASLLNAPADLPQVLFHVLGLLLGITLAITALKLWPRLEPALPKWFQAEIEAPALHPYHKILAWAAMIALVLLSALGITTVIFASVMIMGLVGGIYILFRAEEYILRSMGRLRARLPRLWAKGGWHMFLFMLIGFILILAAVIVVSIWVGVNEDPVTHEVKFLPTVLVIIPSIALVILGITMTSFMAIQTWRAWMLSRERKGKSYGPRRRALMRAHPASLAYYITSLNFTAGGFFFMYALLVVVQSIYEARSHGLNIGVDISGTLVPGELLDYVALATFAVAWFSLMLSLSGAAVRGERRFLNRRVFASLTIFFLMVLFLHVIVAKGDEYFISMAFRAMYMVGLALAPILIYWRRWKAVAGITPVPEEVLSTTTAPAD